MSIIKAALIQMELKADPLADSIETIRTKMIDAHIKLLEDASDQHVNVIGLQEVWTMPYFPAEINEEWFKSAERIPEGPTTQLMMETAKRLNMVIVSPIYELGEDGKLYNTAVVIDSDGRYLGKFRKIHIPKITGFDEKFYFTSGNLGFPVFETAAGKIGVYICYDRHFPEGWRELALNGAELIFNPSATFVGVSDHIWMLEQRGAAVANGLFIGANNRVGREPSLGNHLFYGSSYFTDPRGKVLNKAGNENDELVIAELDYNLIQEVRNQWQFFRDRRPETYRNAARQN